MMASIRKTWSIHFSRTFFIYVVLGCLATTTPANGAGDFTFNSIPAYPATITVNGIVYDSESAQQAWSIQKATNSSTDVYRFEVRDGRPLASRERWR